ncbi:hypothetical protein GOBAR_DD15003 [Gossypium barbadense]|nr:hypothetical protein GOBAR_DD15003 [Gossypium barbadense]
MEGVIIVDCRGTPASSLNSSKFRGALSGFWVLSEVVVVLGYSSERESEEAARSWVVWGLLVLMPFGVSMSLMGTTSSWSKVSFEGGVATMVEGNGWLWHSCL